MRITIQGVLDSISRRILPTLILFSALSVSGSAAFYSVSGLSKLFAGAAFEVMVMAGSLEVAKIVTATLLHRYWKTLGGLLKWYLTLSVVILVLITSMGIYGFLSSAYQDTFNKLMQRDNKVAFLQEKADFYQSDVTRYEKELSHISQNISILSNAKATSIQVRDTTVAGGIRSTVSTAELRLSQKRIDVEEGNRVIMRSKRDQVADSLQKYQLDILQLKSDTSVAGELGPLEYLSGLTGVGMDRIINWLLLTIVFVFDPLAISLILAANFAFSRIRPSSTKSTQEEAPEVLAYEEPLPSVEDEQEQWLEDEASKPPDSIYDDDYNMTEEEIAKLYQIYGESGSLDPMGLDVEFDQVYPDPINQEITEDWEIQKEQHTDFEDSEKNLILDNDDPKIELRNLESYLRRESIGGINPRLETDLKNQIAILKRRISDSEDDSLTKIY